MTSTGDGRARERRTWMSSGELLERVGAKRTEVDTYLSRVARRRRFLTYVVVFGTAVAAVLTSGPAFGGKSFADWLSGVFDSKSPSWQFLCLFATLCSAAALIATQFQRSNNDDENLAKARAVRAALETLDVSVTAGSMTGRDATKEFLRCLEDSSFIDPPQHAGASPRRPGLN